MFSDIVFEQSPGSPGNHSSAGEWLHTLPTRRHDTAVEDIMHASRFVHRCSVDVKRIWLRHDCGAVAGRALDEWQMENSETRKLGNIIHTTKDKHMPSDRDTVSDQTIQQTRE